jgi:hypothetical protein
MMAGPMPSAPMPTLAPQRADAVQARLA